jgi:hypothetical protein
MALSSNSAAAGNILKSARQSRILLHPVSSHHTDSRHINTVRHLFVEVGHKNKQSISDVGSSTFSDPVQLDGFLPEDGDSDKPN